MPWQTAMIHFGIVFMMLSQTIVCAAPPLSTNGVWVETPTGQPVIDRGSSGSWDHYAVDNTYVHIEDGVFYCFYEAQDKTIAKGGHERFGLATSRDGLHWSKSKHNPILDIGPPGSWDSKIAKLPSGIVKRDGKYLLFYSGRNEKTMQIGLATSSQLDAKWKRHSMKPILRSRPELWDQRLTTYPTPVYQSEGVYYLLFRGMTNSHRNQGLGLATSRDLIHWKRHEKSDQKPIIATSEEIGSMAVVHDGKRYVGISQPIDLTKRRYWFSKDLIHWKKGPPVRFRASIAAETLSNPFLVGDTWTVLYEQKDRIYRAVLMPQSTLPK